MLNLNRRYAALIALAVVWGCSPDDYPTEARFDPPPIEIELPDGELFIYQPPADAPEITSMSVAFVTDSDTTFVEMREFADGRWVAALDDLGPGIHEYKYVFNGDTWATNMCNDPVWGDAADGGRVDATVDACADDGSGYAVRVIPVDELPAGELFFYIPPAGVTVTSVAVPGEFNGWNPSAPEAQMELLPDGRWLLAIDGLAPGAYNYKYHFNGDTWAGNMCGDETWGHPEQGDTVDLDLDECVGQDARRVIGSQAAPGHTFLYVVPEGVDVGVVTAAGTFQPEGAQWNNQTDTLTNIWEYTVDLQPGTYQYKYQFNETNGWAGNMCDEGTWGHPDYGNAVDPDNDNCEGENAIITIAEAGPHTFRYIVPEGVGPITQITIAGEFQAAPWTPGVDFFTETFQRHYELAPGTYEYKFIFDGNWAGNMCAEATYAEGGMVDANGEGCVDGGENALLTIE